MTAMQIFFIVGAQKSGTTWLQRSLNGLDGVHCLGEGHFIDRLFQPFAETARSYNQMMQLVAERVYDGNGFYSIIPDTEFRQVMREWILKILLRNVNADPHSILAIGDKTPAHSHHIPTLRSLFPEARFVHMLRDGRDAAVSAFHHQQRILKQLNQADRDASIDIGAAEMFLKWAHTTRAVLRAEETGQEMHTVRYEAMLNNPAQCLKACIQHIIPDHHWDEQEIHAAVEASSFRRQSGRQPGVIDNSAFLRKGQAGSWKTELQSQTFSQISPEDKALLKRLGYDS